MYRGERLAKVSFGRFIGVGAAAVRSPVYFLSFGGKGFLWPWPRNVERRKSTFLAREVSGGEPRLNIIWA